MSLSWSMKLTPVASSVMSPMAMPIITHRPLLISFFFVHPNTLQGEGRGAAGGH